jgi:hypothetical protein
MTSISSPDAPFSLHSLPRGVLGIPHPRVFCAKSSESIEKKRVEFFVSAKECARI